MRRAWLIAAMAAIPVRAEPPLPVYPGTVHTRIGDDLIIGGEHFRIAYFTTRDALTQVADYFFQEWKRRGLPTAVDGDFHTEIVVSAFYTRDGLQRSVVLRRHDGKTVGFSILRDLWVREALAPETEPISLEGTLFSQQLVARDDAGQTKHLSALIKLDLSSAARELREQLANRGFTLSRETSLTRPGDRGLVLQHVAGAARVHTVLTAVDAGLTAMVQTWSPQWPPGTASSGRESSGETGEGK